MKSDTTPERCPDCETPGGSDDGYTCPKHRWWDKPKITRTVGPNGRPLHVTQRGIDEMPATTKEADQLAAALRNLLNVLPQNNSVWPQAIMDAQAALTRYDLSKRKS